VPSTELPSCVELTLKGYVFLSCSQDPIFSNFSVKGTDVGYPGFDPLGMGFGEWVLAAEHIKQQAAEAGTFKTHALWQPAHSMSEGTDQVTEQCTQCMDVLMPFPGDAASLKTIRTKEIANGRPLPWSPAWDSSVQAAYTNKGPVENLLDHLADPAHNNLIEVCISGPCLFSLPGLGICLANGTCHLHATV